MAYPLEVFRFSNSGVITLILKQKIIKHEKTHDREWRRISAVRWAEGDGIGARVEEYGEAVIRERSEPIIKKLL